MEKRKQIYNEKSRGASNSFDNYLNAADAMANSILSKFGDAQPQRDFRDDNQYRGGYSRDDQDEMYGTGNYGRGYGSNNDRNFGRNNRSFSNDRSFGGNNRSYNNDSSFARNNKSFGRNSSREDQRGRRDNNQREGRDRRGLGFATKRDNFGGAGGMGRGRQSDQNRSGYDRFSKPMRKPTEEQIIKELKRRDVYPNTRW